jgi:Asp-tRNA(Asn)/Glu-tRNA(Gln) amidotransferase A subunit family amidase
LAVYDQAVEQLKSAGAVIVEDVSYSWPDGFWTDAYTVLTHEFLDSLNVYLAGVPDPALNRLDLEALIELNQQRSDEILVWFGQEHFEASEASGGTTDENYLAALARVREATGAQGIDRLLDEHDVDLLISPTGGPAWKIDWINGDNFGGGSAGLAAISGYPSITVPMGMVHGLPVGLSFFAGRFSEPTLISATRAFEQQRGPLPRPTLEPTHAP